MNDVQDEFEVYVDAPDQPEVETVSASEPDQTTATAREPLGDITAMFSVCNDVEKVDLVEKKGTREQKPGLPPRPQAQQPEDKAVTASAVKRGLSFALERSPSKVLPR